MMGRILVLIVAALAAPPVQADKGHIWPDPVSLSETAQRAILLHDGQQELLILGVDLVAARRGQVLEFVPFPSEPAVSAVAGDPFARVQRLIAAKRLERPPAEPTKGGAGPTAPIELRFSARIGVHDVSAVEVKDAAAFEGWVRRFLAEKGLPAGLDLGRVLPVAQDYLRRGFRHFVFDRVSVETELRSAEPLAYRFRSDRIYYPLLTSNIVGGKGAVELVMILPGSFLVEEAPEAAQRLWSTLRRIAGTPGAWIPSSSAKITAEEAEAVHAGARAFFARTPKLYLQVLEYAGPYRFAEDLFLDPGDLRPFPSKFPPSEIGPASLDVFPGFTEEEIEDYCQANGGSPPCQARAARTRSGGER